MEAQYKTKSGSLTFKLSGETPKDIFKAIAGVQDVFENNKCEACGGTDLRYQVRTVDENEYFEIRCLNSDCRAKLAYGQNKKGGGLFAKRKDKDNNWIANHGWEIWTGTKDPAF